MSSVQITLRDGLKSAALETHILKKIQKIDMLNRENEETRWQIVIEPSQKHKHTGKLYNIKIDMTVRGKEIAVTKKIGEDLYVAIRDAFLAIKRRLFTLQCKRQNRIKSHENPACGRVLRLLTEDGFGFIQGVNGEEYYFSLSNVHFPNSRQLKLGDWVEFLPVNLSMGLHAEHVCRIRESH